VIETVRKRRAHVYVGPAGWDYADWKGVVFPQRMPRGVHPLTYISRLFNTVEINSTFYRPARPEYAARWVRYVEARPEFKFTAKLWRRFTHDRDSLPDTSEVDAVRSGFEPLVEADRFGGLLVQFPWSFRNSSDTRWWLDMVLDKFAEYPLAIEVRHSSWNVPEMYDHLRERRVAICNIDQPQFRDSIPPGERVTARLGYVRLHGQNYNEWFREGAGRDARYNYLYSEAELEPWIEKIGRMDELAETVYVITNNHYRGKAVVNALELVHKLTGKAVEVPEPLEAAYPQLASISMHPDRHAGTQMSLPGL